MIHQIFTLLIGPVIVAIILVFANRYCVKHHLGFYSYHIYQFKQLRTWGYIVFESAVLWVFDHLTGSSMAFGVCLIQMLLINFLAAVLYALIFDRSEFRK